MKSEPTKEMIAAGVEFAQTSMPGAVYTWDQFIKELWMTMQEFEPQAARQQAVPSDTALRRAGLFLDGLHRECKEVQTLRRLLAAAPQAEQAVPSGYVMVPVEMTDAMCEASGDECEPRKSAYQVAADRWAKILAAAPQAEQRCPDCDGSGDVHSLDGEWRGECHCQAEQAVGAVATDPAKCDDDVFNYGVSIGLFDMPKEEAEKYCAHLTSVTGCQHDWHYIGGRVHVKALSKPRPAPPAPDVSVLVSEIERSFPLLDDEGLDEVEHHCEWALQQDRKRLHALIATHRSSSHD